MSINRHKYKDRFSNGKMTGCMSSTCNLTTSADRIETAVSEAIKQRKNRIAQTSPM